MEDIKSTLEKTSILGQHQDRINSLDLLSRAQDKALTSCEKDIEAIKEDIRPMIDKIDQNHKEIIKKLDGVVNTCDTMEKGLIHLQYGVESIKKQSDETEKKVIEIEKSRRGFLSNFLRFYAAPLVMLGLLIWQVTSNIYEVRRVTQIVNEKIQGKSR